MSNITQVTTTDVDKEAIKREVDAELKKMSYLFKPGQQRDEEEQIKPSPFGQLSIQDINKVFISKIPKGVSDEFMERIIKSCGQLNSWKRITDSQGELKTFGYAEMKTWEGVFGVFKILSSYEVFENKLTVKVDTKAEALIDDWVNLKKAEWISNQ